MAMKTQLYPSNSFSTLTNSMNFDKNQNIKMDTESKKIFSRKPNKTQQKSSRFAPNLLKTQ